MDTAEIIDTRNILPSFKGNSTEEIKEILQHRSHNFSVLISNKTKNLASGTLVRNCNSFGAKSIVFYGRREYNRTSAVGSYAYCDISVAHDMTELKEFISLKKIDRVVALENNVDYDTTFLDKYNWNPSIHYLFCIGNEHGNDEEILDICDDFIEIRNYGCTPSLNLAAAGGILFYDYCSRVAKPQGA